MILIVLAHPDPKHSNANKQLLDTVSGMNNVVINDLYDKYPDFHINIKAEQKLLTAAKLVIFQFPIYWYNVPALLKQWQEVVLTRGFAFGKSDQERNLSGKPCLALVTTGHKKLSYQKDGYDQYSIEEFLRPMEQMAYHCKMKYHSPLVVYRAHRANDSELNQLGKEYSQRILDHTLEDTLDHTLEDTLDNGISNE